MVFKAPTNLYIFLETRSYTACSVSTSCSIIPKQSYFIFSVPIMYDYYYVCILKLLNILIDMVVFIMWDAAKFDGI